MWNFKGYLWNSTQNISPIHWKMWILFTCENLRALRFKSSYMFLKTPPGPIPTQRVSYMEWVPYDAITGCKRTCCRFFDICMLQPNLVLTRSIFRRYFTYHSHSRSRRNLDRWCTHNNIRNLALHSLLMLWTSEYITFYIISSQLRTKRHKFPSKQQ